MISSESLKRALDVQQQIEKLQSELEGILGGSAKPVRAAATPVAAPVAAPKAANAPKAPKALKAPKAKIQSLRRPPFAGQKRPASPSGPLGPAVVKIIKRAGKPIGVAEIYAGLMADKYAFTSSDPKKNLNARVYRLPGVKPLGAGKFTLG